ncbi:uncharacterized protein LOC143191979 isoform X1 [Rhynchophorus ferrugineus]|uniref:uncharacterized protein LOC143191979 isoform X1 n=1 Tax=Rhynchophorus ferrugineus TaxID=354439 RepID=UPI003FCE1F38
MDLWNHRFLPSPPVNSYKATGINIEFLDHTKFRHSVQQTITHLKDQEYLIRETAVLSRMIYRLKLKYRNSKDFKTIEKLKHSLNIFLKNDLINHLNLLLDIIPTYYSIDTYLPTKNMVSYILVRIQGLVKLLERIYETCKIGALQINQKISTGHFWKLSFLMFSVISRISILTKHNTKMLCESYGRLYPYIQKLENSGKEWLPSTYILPPDLREWLAVSWVYEEDYIDLTVQTNFNDVIEILNLIDDDDVEISDEYIIIKEDESNDIKDFNSNKNTLNKDKMRGFSIDEDDIGVEIIDSITNSPTKKLNSNMKNGRHISNADKYIDLDSETSNNMFLKPLKAEDQSIIIISDSPNKNKSGSINSEDAVNPIDNYLDQLKNIQKQTVKKTFQQNIITIDDFDKNQHNKCGKKRKNKSNNTKKLLAKNINSPNDLRSEKFKKETDEDNDVIIIPDSPSVSAGPSQQARYIREDLKTNKLSIQEEKTKPNKKNKRKKLIYRKVSSNWPRKLNMFRTE